ncbi:MAG: hypothetical protein AAF939_10765 [Planctomycetota bacterium]
MLASLEVVSTGLFDANCVQKCKILRALKLHNCQVHDLNSIKDLPLESLVLNDVKGIEDFSFLSGFGGLKALTLITPDRLDDPFKYLGQLKELEYCLLQAAEEFEISMRGIEKNTGLRELIVSNPSRFDLKRCKQLERLSVIGGKMGDVEIKDLLSFESLSSLELFRVQMSQDNRDEIMQRFPFAAVVSTSN